MKRIKKNKKHIGLEDYIKAAKKGSREAEQELLGPGLRSRTGIAVWGGL